MKRIENKLKLLLCLSLGFICALLTINFLPLTSSKPITDLTTSAANLENETEPQDGVAYHVKHYLEDLYDLTDDDDNDNGPIKERYKLQEGDTQTLYGEAGTKTAAETKDYPGFKAYAFEQQTISESGDTVVEIYYKRQSYTLTIKKGTGIINVDGEGKYLFGAQIELQPTIENAYEWYAWSIESCQDENFIQDFNRNLSSSQALSFTMPASDLTLTAKARLKTFLITIKIKGKGTVKVDDDNVNKGNSGKYAISANYGNHTFEFLPAKGYQLEAVYLDGVAEDLDDSSLLSTIIADSELSVTFTKIPAGGVNPALWVVGGGLAILLFGASGIMLYLSFRGPRQPAPQPISPEPAPKVKTGQKVSATTKTATKTNSVSKSQTATKNSTGTKTKTEPKSKQAVTNQSNKK